MTNWFFHRVYWSEWIGRFHRQRKRLEKVSKTGFISAQALGLLMLGLTSIYREGFETVLFLQSLELSAGAATVLEGTALGLLAHVRGRPRSIFIFQQKLPYKKMLIFTGVMIGVVLVVMVGQTARTMQGTGWLPITSLDIDLRTGSACGSGCSRRWRPCCAQVIAASVRDRLVLRGAGGPGQAPAPQGDGRAGGALRREQRRGARGGRDRGEPVSR